MSDTELTSPRLRHELRRRVVQYTFSGPLLLAWSVGLVPFLIMFDRPLFAVVWCGAMVILGFLIAADSLRTSEVYERLIRSIVHRRFRAREVTGRSLKAAVD